MTLTREGIGPRTKKGIVKNYYAFELEKDEAKECLMSENDRQAFALLEVDSLLRVEQFVEVEKCGFVRRNCTKTYERTGSK